jgi:hypothetical protein
MTGLNRRYRFSRRPPTLSRIDRICVETRISVAGPIDRATNDLLVFEPLETSIFT